MELNIDPITKETAKGPTVKLRKLEGQQGAEGNGSSPGLVNGGPEDKPIKLMKTNERLVNCSQKQGPPSFYS